jgi:hypothetical protein
LQEHEVHVQIEGQDDEKMVRSQGEAGDRLSQPSSPAQLIKHGKEEKHALIAGEASAGKNVF